MLPRLVGSGDGGGTRPRRSTPDAPFDHTQSTATSGLSRRGLSASNVSLSTGSLFREVPAPLLTPPRSRTPLLHYFACPSVL